MTAGDLVIPSESVRRFLLVPGQHVQVSVHARPVRRNIYGALAGRLLDVAPDDISQVRHEVWGDLATGQ